MSLHRLWTITLKEFRHIWRDKRILFLVTLSPAIMLVTFSYLFAMEVQKTRLGIWDLDRSALSRQFVASLTADGKYEVVATPDDYTALNEAMMRGQIHFGIVIPPDFGGRLRSGQRAPVQVLADGSDAITIARSLGSLRERIMAFNARIEPESESLSLPISVRAQAWYNPELQNTWAMVPGLIPIVMILPSLAIALAITRERELGSFETLITAPIQALEYLAGKLIPYMLFGLLSASLAMLIASLWFRVPLRGAVLDLGLLTLVYLFASLCESLFICNFIDSQGTAMRVILILFFIPSFFLAGVILPIDAQSGVGQAGSLLLPATYFVRITRGIYLRGMGLAELSQQALSLLALGGIPFLLSVLMFRKQVD